jgi:cytidylate kinase
VTRRRFCVAIDGPVAAGKSTIARLLALALGYTYIDSGAMYRALAWAARRAEVSPDDPERIANLLETTNIHLHQRKDGSNEVIVDGEDVTIEIRTPDISQLSSRLSERRAVRRRMVALQREMAKDGGVVMEGRDIQTVVLPKAEVKIFLTASPEERARRRALELRSRGFETDFQEVLAEVRARDERDSKRRHSPLRAAPDAVTLDTTGLTIKQVVEQAMAVARDKAADRGPTPE